MLAQQQFTPTCRRHQPEILPVEPDATVTPDLRIPTTHQSSCLGQWTLRAGSNGPKVGINGISLTHVSRHVEERPGSHRHLIENPLGNMDETPDWMLCSLLLGLPIIDMLMVDMVDEIISRPKTLIRAKPTSPGFRSHAGATKPHDFLPEL